MSLFYINPYPPSQPRPLATGGNTVNDYSEGGINYRAHIFTSNGTLTFGAGGPVEYLVVAGGGGGGGGFEGGGGGAGGYLSASTSVTARDYTVTIGDGGTGRTVGGAAATNGGNSVLQDIATAVGGGRGATENVNASANTGGSGGGGTWFNVDALVGAAGTPGQGFAGGDGAVFSPFGNNNFVGGGGGGSSSVGSNGVNNTHPTPGGAGTSNSYSNTATVYAAGGNGALRSSNTNGSNASANTGNGGNAGANASGQGLGGNGGSGIVIVRYAATGAGLAVGDTGPGGGTVFLISAGLYYEFGPNQGTRTWSTGGNQTLSVTGADSTAIGTGYQNTLDIIAQSGNVSGSCAAVLARAYTNNGFSDWFLPSKDEAIQMASTRATTGFANGAQLIWTSSETAANRAWMLWDNYEPTDSFGGANKAYSARAYPIRRGLN